jgi:hypothetical protein
LNDNENLDQAAVIFEIVILDIFYSLFLSMSWVLSSIASFVLKALTYQLIVDVNSEIFLDLLIYPLCFCQLLQTVALYLFER